MLENEKYNIPQALVPSLAGVVNQNYLGSTSTITFPFLSFLYHLFDNMFKVCILFL